jgi:ACS family hexuronate transporter-like MFS transporter
MTICVLLNLPFATIPWMPAVATVLGAMFLAMFVASGFVVLSVAYATHIYKEDYAGLIAGAGAGSWSLMVALLMPIFGRIFDLHQYFKAFWIAAAIPVLGYGAWLGFARLRLRRVEQIMV